MDQVEFLRQRIDEDQRVAEAADHGSCWYDCDDGHGDHHQRWDPARVLRDVEAKRRIVERHQLGSWHSHVLDADVRTCQACGTADEDWPCPDLRLLAVPYADHPDYRAEWRP